MLHSASWKIRFLLSRAGWLRFPLALLVPAGPLAGWMTGHFFLGCVAGAIAACLFGLCASLRTARGGKLAELEDRRTRRSPASPPAVAPTNHASPPPRSPQAARPESKQVERPEELVDRMIRQGRYALLLRPQLVGSLSPAALDQAKNCLQRQMAVVPEGLVQMSPWRGDDWHETSRGRRVRVEALYLDRYPVTNAQFQAFVAAGGYEQMALWEPAVWPAILEFVDATGHPGPRFWRDGRFPAGLADHPVVGVSWYEAWAYARWVGKRLVTDPEWVKAGCWPVATDAENLVQRKFPWGDTMHREYANLWGTGADATCSVHDLPEGTSVGGVYHLIGNVWEWTANNFGVWDEPSERAKRSSALKSLRGGAFDTYFETQATCHFQSGDSPLARKHNIGFRCAISAGDLASEVLEVEEVLEAGNAESFAARSGEGKSMAGDVR